MNVFRIRQGTDYRGMTVVLVSFINLQVSNFVSNKTKFSLNIKTSENISLFQI
jgi:hypothetical protein